MQLPQNAAAALGFIWSFWNGRTGALIGNRLGTAKQSKFRHSGSSFVFGRKACIVRLLYQRGGRLSIDWGRAVVNCLTHRRSSFVRHLHRLNSERNTGMKLQAATIACGIWLESHTARAAERTVSKQNRRGRSFPVIFRSHRRLSRKLIRWVTRKLK